VLDILLRLRGNGSEALAALRSVGGALSALQGQAASAGSTILRTLGAPARTAASVLDAVFRTTQQSAASLVNGLSRLGLGVFALRELGNAVSGLGRSFISNNVALESVLVSYTTLLGSLDAARARFAELQQINLKSPFELPEIIQVDRLFESLGRRTRQLTVDALNAATALQQPVQEIGFAISRVAAGDFGFAFARLRELGVATRAQLEGEGLVFDRQNSYQGSVEDALAAVQAIIQRRFGAAAEAASQTFSGIQSNVVDRLNQLRTILGAPIFDVLKAQLQNLLTTLGNPQFERVAAIIGQGIAQGLSLAITIVQRAGSAFVAFGQQAYSALSQVTGGVPQFIGTILATFAPLGAAIDALLRGDFNRAAQLVGSFVSNIASILLSGLGSLAGSLFSGGVNTIAAYADGLISGAASYVTQALNYITSLIASFLQGFSPPKQGKLSTIDTWFGPVIDAYLSGWTDADFGVLDQITNTIAQRFERLVAQGRATVADAGRIVIGTNGAPGLNRLVAQAIDEIRQGGRITTDTLLRIQGVLGQQYQDIFQEIRGQLDAAALDREIRDLQARLQGLNDPQTKQALDDALARAQQAMKDARDPQSFRAAKAQVAIIKQQQQEQDRQRATLEAQINALETQRKVITDQLAGQEALVKLRERELQFLERIANAQERASGGGGGGGVDKAELEAKRRAEAEFQYQLSIADTAGQLELQNQRLAELEAGSVEHTQTRQEIARLERQQADEQRRIAEEQQRQADERNDAERDYNYAIADTAGKIAILEQELTGMDQNSAEAYRKRIELEQLRQQQADEAKRTADEEAAQQERLEEAQFRYALAIADTAGKIDLYKQKLAGLNPTQAEYYDTLSEIAGLERQLASERAQAAKGGKAGSGGAVPNVSGLPQADLSSAGTSFRDTIAEATAEAKQSIDDFWTNFNSKIEDGKQRLNDIRESATGFVDTFKQSPAGQFLGGIVQQVQETARWLTEGSGAARSFSDTVRSTAPPSGFQQILSILMPLVGVLAGVAAGFATFSVLSTIAGAVGTFTATIAGLVAALNPVTLIILAVSAAIAGLVFAFTTNIGGVRDVLLPIFATIGQQIADLAPKFQLFLQNLAGAIEPMKAAFTSMLPVLAVIGAAIIGVFSGVIGFIGGALPGLGMAISGVVTFISGLVQVLYSVIGGLVSIVVALIQGDWSGAWQAAKDMVAGVGEGIVNIISGLVQTVVGLVGGLIGGVIGFFQNMYDVLVGNSIVPDMVTAIVDWFLSLARDGVAFVTDLVDFVIGSFDTLKLKAVLAISGFVTDALERFGELYTSATTRATELKDKVVEEVTALKDRGVELFGNLMTEAQSKIDGLKQNVIDAVVRVKDGVVGLATDFLTGAKTIGENIIQGIKNGIENGIEAVKDMARRAAQAALDAAKSLLGISSPSRVFDLQVGRPSMDGLVRGLEHGSRGVIDEARRIAAALTQPFEHAAPDLSAMLRGVQGQLASTPLTLAMQAAHGYGRTPPTFAQPIVIEDKRSVTVVPPAGASMAEVEAMLDRKLGQDREALLREIKRRRG
jgi:phage-related protein